jgi:hypothetical protein
MLLNATDNTQLPHHPAVAQPGYEITTCGATGCSAQLCNYGFYNPGGVGNSVCIVCPWGFTTRVRGSAGEGACRE